jgi:hypothetical protein
MSRHGIVTAGERSHAWSGSEGSRVRTSSAARMPYGAQAMNVETPLPSGTSDSSSSMPLTQSSFHVARAGKSHLSLGMSQPWRATKTVIARPTGAPRSDGNSGPRKVPKSTYGTVNASPPKIVKGRIDSPSVHDLLAP